MKKLLSLVGKYPFVAFVAALAALLVIVIIGARMRAADTSSLTDRQEFVRTVDVYSGEVHPQIELQARVDRADSLTLVAVTGGVLQEIQEEGAVVYKGTQIARLADNYDGTSAASVQAAQASRALEFQNTLYVEQEKLYEYQEDTVGKTQATDKKIERKQIDIQERTNEFNLDNARIQAQLAYTNASLYKIVAPLAGVVEETLAKVGDYVSPGQVLAVLKTQNTESSTIIAYVGKDRIQSLDETSNAIVLLGEQEFSLPISYVALSAVQTSLYAVTIEITDALAREFTDGEYVSVKLPLKTLGQIIVPIDALRYSNDSVEVYIATSDEAGVTIAQTRTVQVDSITGGFALISSGISMEDQVILDRSVSDGERVKLRQDSVSLDESLPSDDAVLILQNAGDAEQGQSQLEKIIEAP